MYGVHELRSVHMMKQQAADRRSPLRFKCYHLYWEADRNYKLMIKEIGSRSPA
jgi:hypothetical protein